MRFFLTVYPLLWLIFFSAPGYGVILENDQSEHGYPLASPSDSDQGQPLASPFDLNQSPPLGSPSDAGENDVYTLHNSTSNPLALPDLEGWRPQRRATVPPEIDFSLPGSSQSDHTALPALDSQNTTLPVFDQPLQPPHSLQSNPSSHSWLTALPPQPSEQMQQGHRPPMQPQYQGLAAAGHNEDCNTPSPFQATGSIPDNTNGKNYIILRYFQKRFPQHLPLTGQDNYKQTSLNSACRLIATTLNSTYQLNLNIAPHNLNMDSIFSSLDRYLEHYIKNTSRDWSKQQDYCTASMLLEIYKYLTNDGYGIDTLIEKYKKSPHCQHWNENNPIYRGGVEAELEKAQNKKTGKKVVYINIAAKSYGKGLYVTGLKHIAKEYASKPKSRHNDKGNGIVLKIKLNPQTAIIGLYNNSAFHRFLQEYTTASDSIEDKLEESARKYLLLLINETSTIEINRINSNILTPFFTDIAATKSLLIFMRSYDYASGQCITEVDFEIGIIKDTDIIRTISAYPVHSFTNSCPAVFKSTYKNIIMKTKVHIKTEPSDHTGDTLVKKELPPEHALILLQQDNTDIIKNCTIIDERQPNAAQKADVFLCRINEEQNQDTDQTLSRLFDVSIDFATKEYKYFIYNESGKVIRVRPCVSDLVKTFKKDATIYNYLLYSKLHRFLIQYHRTANHGN